MRSRQARQRSNSGLRELAAIMLGKPILTLKVRGNAALSFLTTRRDSRIRMTPPLWQSLMRKAEKRGKAVPCEHRTQPFRRLGYLRYSARLPCAACLLWIFQAGRRAIIQKGDSGKMRLETAFLALLALHLWATIAALLVAAL
jgi:hypothetical protein